MEDVINYLVIGFFVISFLSSLFKKKPPQKGKTPAWEKTNAEPSSKEVIDPFKILFNDFEEKGFPEEQTDQYHVESYEQSQNLSEVDKYYEDALRKSTESETASDLQNYSVELQKERINQISDDTVYREKEEILLPPLTPHVNTTEKTRADEIRIRLNNPQTLKDYVLIKEILGEPKALQE